MNSYKKRMKWLLSVLLSFMFVGLFVTCKDNPTENQEKLEPIDFLPISHEIEGWIKSLVTGDFIDAGDEKKLKGKRALNEEGLK